MEAAKIHQNQKREKKTLRCSFYDTAELSNEGVLGTIKYAIDEEAFSPYQCTTALKPAPNSLSIEQWSTTSKVIQEQKGSTHIAQAKDFQLLSTRVDERDFTDLESATQHAYKEILSLVIGSSHPNLIRMWNYLPHINQGLGDDERYRIFCLGRHKAFESHHFTQGMFPAASAIGTRQGHYIDIYTLSSRNPGRHFENPSQMSAYHYPREHGKKSPSFARATLLEEGNRNALFISGTASIIGHETLHVDCFDKQLEVTLNNIETLIQHVEKETGHEGQTVIEGLKVYLRDLDNKQQAEEKIQQVFGNIDTCYLEGDICRGALVVEIEAICQL